MEQSKLYASLLNVSMTLIILLLVSTLSLAQTPYISGISNKSTTVGIQITISGGNFSTNQNEWLVTFGAQSVLADAATVSSIKVTVPPGATTDNVMVTNLTTGLVAISPELFYLSFGGAQGSFNKDRLGSLIDPIVETGGIQTQDICMCDFDRNGLNDLAVSHEGFVSDPISNNFISVIVNSSTRGNLNLSHSSIDPEQRIITGFNSKNITCGDLNGDGYPDLVATNSDLGGDRIILVQNAGTGNIDFDSPVTLTVPRTDEGDLRRIPRRAVLHDIDLDGKLDIVVTLESHGLIDIFRNIGTPGGDLSSDSFAEPFELVVSGAANAYGLDVKDLNNDGLPDIAVTDQDENNFYVFQNNSDPGNIAFRASQMFNVTGALRHLKLADFDGNGFLDVAITEPTGISAQGNVHVIFNTTAGKGQLIDFTDSPLRLTNAGLLPWGLDVGDIEGDGDIDIVVSSSSTNDTSIYVIENKGTTTGNIFEDPLQLNKLRSNSKHIKLGDLDGDGRPDFAFTHKSNSSGVGQVGAFLNNNCVTPVISPDEEPQITICDGGSVELSVTKTTGYNYVWRNGAATIPGETGNSITVATDGAYSVFIDKAGCSISSNVVNVVVDPSVFGTPSITTSDEPLCTQSDLNLTLDADGETDVTFHWTGPNDFNSNEQNPTIEQAGPINSGTYAVYMTHNTQGCISAADEIDIQIINVPNITVINTDGSAFCDDGVSSIDLSVTDISDKGDFSLEWFVDGSPIQPAENGQTYNVTSGGTYSVQVSTTDGNNCTLETAPEVITVRTTPSPDFNADNLKCVGLEITFVATTSPSVPMIHHWDFGTGDESTGSGVTYTYNAEGEYTASVRSTYSDVLDENCEYDVAEQLMTITAPPALDQRDLIRSHRTDPTVLEKCPSGNLRTRIEGGPYDLIVWQIASENYNFDQLRNSGNTFRFDDPDMVFATITDASGCIYNTDTVAVTNFVDAGAQIAADLPVENDLDLGKIINLEDGQTSIELSATNVPDSVEEALPLWFSQDTISIFNITDMLDVIVFPRSAHQKVYLTANDLLGCRETDSVTLVTPPLQADRNFSPNGDGINDCWEVANVSSRTCSISIFDSKGRFIKKVNDTSTLDEESCVWDGTANGSQLPSGVYYYVVQCSGDNARKSGGSILLAR